MSVMVLLDDEYVDAGLVKDKPHLFQVQLERAKRLANAKCCCDPLHPLDMVVRQLPAGRILASWPGTVELHAGSCPFRSLRPPSTQTSGSNCSKEQHKPVAFYYREGWMYGERPAIVQKSETKVDVDLPWLLSELWQSSLLSSWHKGWVRDWTIIKKRLMRALLHKCRSQLR